MLIQENRKLIKITQSRKSTIGSGFTAWGIGRDNLDESVDPFLQLDQFFMSQPTFTSHPHAGFSAVTYMFEDSEGAFFNRDSLGGQIPIFPGDLHWSQAGSGIIHNEVPIESGKICHGIQMFVNLASVHKFSDPQSFHLASVDVPVFKADSGGRVRVLVGTAFGLTSPLHPLTDIIFLDVSLPPHAAISHVVPLDHNAFVFLIQGQGYFGATKQELSISEAGLFGKDGEAIKVTTAEQSLQYIFCAGKPLNEPIYAQGSFVMNSAAQIQQVYEDYRAGKMGRID
jgi:redox-sensitive bicupin YhaK (pirin superfamily)